MQIPRFFLASQDVTPAGGARGRTAHAGGSTSGTSGAALDLAVGETVAIGRSDIVAQVKNVLRMRQGDQLILLNGHGLLFNCTLTALTPALECRVEQRSVLPPDSSAYITVALAILKGDRFDWALQKLTELGVSSIVPLITERTVVKVPRDAKGQQSRLARWQAIVREAAEQSERATIPRVVAPADLQTWLQQFDAGGTRDTAFICAERLATGHLKDIFLPVACHQKDRPGTADTTIYLIVGPEGGFTGAEIANAEKRGVKPVSLGRRILRSETAAIYSLAQVIWCLEKNS